MTFLTDNNQVDEPQLPVAYDCIFFRQVNSLRDKAAELANNGADEGCLIWSIAQHNAKARLNKTWICNTGDLHCSIILRPDFEPAIYEQMLIVAIVSLGNSIASYVSPMTALGYQWPNDVCIANHKIASVWLDEGKSDGTRWLAITVSVNVLNAPEDPEINAVSIREIEGSTELNNKLLLESYAREFIKQINNWSQRGYKYIFDQWHVRLQTIDHAIALKNGNETITASVINVDENGDIVVCYNDEIRTISLKTHMGLCE